MMHFNPLRCPQCNTLPKGTLESVQSAAHLVVNEDALAEYGGWTEIFWGTQETLQDAQRKVTLIGTCDHEWQAEMLDVECDSRNAAGVVHDDRGRQRR